MARFIPLTAKDISDKEIAKELRKAKSKKRPGFKKYKVIKHTSL